MKLKDIQIKVIPIIKYPSILKKLKTIPKYLGELEGKTNNDVFAMLPDLVANCLPDVIAILSEATGVSEDEIGQCGFDEVVEILIEVIKVNRFVEAIERIKKETAHRKAETTPTNG